MNDASQIIATYLRETRPTYALMIDGPWGSGKTYHWLHTVAPEAQSLKAPATKKHFRTAYVSLYGIARVEDISTEIFMALHPALNTQTGKLIRGIGGMLLGPAGDIMEKKLGVKLPNVKVKLADWARMDDAVLCFDDFERCSIPLNELLGHINQYVEHKGARVLILCNEQERAEYQANNYRTMKEKVVGQTVQFRPDHDHVVASVINEYARGSSFHKFLKRHQATLLDLFKRSELDNIRIFTRAIAHLQTVYKAARHCVPEDAGIKERLLRLLVPLTLEFLSGRGSKEELREIAVDGLSVFYAQVLGKDEKPKFFSDYVSRYHNGSLTMTIHSEALFNYVVNGYWDKNAFFAELQKLTAKKEPFDEALERLTQNNPLYLSDEEVRSKTRLLLDAVGRSEISEYVVLFRLFVHSLYWAHWGLIAESRDDIKSLFSMALRNGTDHRLFNFEQYLSDHMSYLGEGDDPDVRQFREAVIASNASQIAARNKGVAEEWVASLRLHPKEAIMKLADDFWDVPILDLVDDAELLEVFQHLPNELKALFRLAFDRRYVKNPSIENIRDQVTGIKRISNRLAAWVGTTTERPRSAGIVIADQLLADMKKVLARLG
jgi:KAP family P-loop domain